MDAVAAIGTGLLQSREGGICTPAVTRYQHDAGAERGQPGGGNLPDAGRCAGDDDDLAVNGSLLR
jgi:hypothetical protein